MMPMRYKDFVWPNNPSSCYLELKKEVATHKYPGNSFQLEELGEGQRIFRGQGEFYGEFAYTYMESLVRTYEEKGPGALIHPVLELRQAYFTELTLLEEPRENYVAYTCVFQEDGSIEEAGTELSATEGYTVRMWESLWDVAEKCGTTVELLLSLNPWIRNPNRLELGRQVKLK